MQALYQLDIQGPELLEYIGQFFMENEEDDLVRKRALEWTKGTWENVAVCDKLIAGSIIKWGLSRLSLVDKNILRLAVYQLKFCNSIPPKVVINEAIELAKKFGTVQSPSFVNGVLDAILKKIVSSNSNRKGGVSNPP